MKDPQRWLEDPQSPKGADTLLSGLEDAPPFEEGVRARVRDQLLHATAVTLTPQIAWRAPVLGATAVVLAGILIWRFQPVAEPEVELHPEVAAAVDRAVDRAVEEPVAAPVPAPPSAPVRITSAPVGATIFVDGVMRGVAPLLLDLPEGTHVVEAQLEGYEPARVSILASAGERASVALALGETAPIARATMGSVTRTRTEARREVREPASELGHLVINTMPWSRVYIDGDLIGTTPIRRHGVTAGSHRVRFRTAAGYERVVTVRVRAGETKRLIMRLERTATMTDIVDVDI